MSWSGGISPAAAPEVAVVPPALPRPADRAGIGGMAGPGDLEPFALALGLRLNATVEDIRQGIVSLRQDAASGAGRAA